MSGDVVSEAVGVIAHVSRTARLTAPEQADFDATNEPVVGARSDVNSYEFSLLSGRDTRGPPVVHGDLASEFSVYAPLSSNSSSDTTYGNHNCPDSDRSQSVCGNGMLILSIQDTLVGNQNLGQSVFNNGLVSPGNSPGILNIDGDFTQSSSGTLLIEVFGLLPGVGGYDQVNVDGNVTLDGLLQVMLDAGFASSLVLGDEIEFLTYTGTLTGDFANVSGLGIPGTSLFLMPEHDVANKRYILKVESVVSALTQELRDGIDLAAERLNELGVRLQSVLDPLRQPLPVVNRSLFDLMGSSAERRLAEFLDFTDEIEQFRTTANSELDDLIASVNGKITSLLDSLSGSPVGNVSAYLVTIGGRDELHVEFVFDWVQVVSLGNLDLAATLDSDTLSQLGLSFSGTSDIDVTFGFDARFGIVIDATSPTSIDHSKIAVELTQLEISAEVSEPVTGIAIDLNTVGSGIGITSGQFDMTAALAVTLTQLDDANRVTVDGLSTLFTLGFAASVESQWSGSLDIRLPLVVTLGGNLNSFGQPIVRIQNDLLGNGGDFESVTSVSVDIDITDIRTELLDLLDEIQAMRPSLDDLPFAIPAGFGLATLFDAIGGLLTLRPDAENYYNAIDAFQLDMNTQLAQFRTLLGLAADFDDVTGNSDSNPDLTSLVDLLADEYAVHFETGGLTFAEISSTVLAQFGTFATMGGLVAHLINTRDLTAEASLFGITFEFAGGYDPSTRELFLNVQADFSGTETFTNVALRDLADAIVTVIDGLKNNDTFRQATGTTDVGTFEYDSDTGQWQLIAAGAAFPTLDPMDPDNPGPMAGDLFRLTAPVDQAGVYRYDGSNWNVVAVASTEDLPSNPSDGDLMTLLASDATGLTIDENSLAVPDGYDADGNVTGTTESVVGTIEFKYSTTLDLTVGLDLDSIADGSGTIGPDIAFVRVNGMDASVSMDFSDVSLALSIDGPGGSDAAVALENASFFLSGGVSMVSDPVTVTLADILGGVSLVDLANSLDFVKQGAVSAVLPLSFDVQIGAPIDTTQFGSPTVLIDDLDLFDDRLPEIRISFVIGPALQTALEDLVGHWDSLIGDLFGGVNLNASLPLIGESVLGLLDGFEGNGIVDALSFQSVLTSYFTTASPTVDGLVQVLSDTLNIRLGQLFAGLPFDISGGLVWPEVGGAVFTIDIGIDMAQSFGFDVDMVQLLAETGQTEQILDALSDLGVQLNGDFLLAVEATLQGGVALTLDASGLVNGTSTITGDDLSIEFNEEFTAEVTVEVSDLDLGIDFSAAVPGLAPGIENGILDLNVIGTLGLTGTASENTITVTEVLAGVSDNLDVVLTGTFSAVLPITGLVEAIPDVSGTFVLRISKDDLFNLAIAPETIIDAELTISEFVYLRGSIAGFLATRVTVTLENASTKLVDMVTIGIGDAELFIGAGGPSHIDLDGNGAIDADEMNDDAIGLAVSDANLAIAIFAPANTGDANRYFAIGMTATSVSPIGLPLDFSLTLTDASFALNYGSDNAVDFMATDFGDGVGNGLMVATGAAPFVLDMDAAILQAEATVQLNLGGFVLVTGTFAFSVEEGEVVTDETGIAKVVDILTIGAGNVNVLVGSMNAAGDALVAGLQMTGTSFGIAIMNTTNAADDGVYYAMKATATAVTPVGLPPEVVITATNVLLAINTGNDGAVDFTHGNTNYSGQVNVGGGSTVDLDFATELYEASATLSIALGSHVFLDGTFAFRRGPAQLVTLSDESQKQVSGFTIGGTNANVFIGTGGPYPANPSAEGFALTDVDFGLAIMTSLEGDGYVYYALEATVGSAAMVNLTEISLAADLITIAVNGSTDASGAVIDFANSGFDGADENTEPDGYLEVITGGEQPVEIDLSEAVIRVEVTAGAITVDGSHTMSGNYVFELSNDGMGQPQFIAGISDLAFNGTQAIEEGVGVLVIKDTGVALLVFGRASAGGGGLAIESGLGLRVNTTGGAVNETITVDGQDILLASAGDEIAFFAINLTFTIGDNIYISGDLTLNQSVTLGAGPATLASGLVDIFVGAGPYVLSDGEINPDAVGILITNALVAILTDVNGGSGLALWAEGDVQFVGVPGVQASGTVRVEVNTTGVAITDDLDITDGLGMPLGTAAFDFLTTDDINRATGNVTVAVPDVFEINGEFTFSTLPNEMLEVDIANMELRIFPEDATNEAFSITAHATFTIDRNDGFKLRFIQVENFSIYNVDAGNATSGTPPPELAQTLGFPDVTVGGGGNPIAALMNPLQGATVDVTTLSAQGFIDITYSVGTVDILDSGAEFTLTGDGVSADLRIDNNSVEHLYGTTYRYQLVDADPTNDTDIFVVPGGSSTATVTVNFIAGSFTNSVTGVTNLADATNSFTIEDSAASASGVTFNVGPLQIIGPKLQLSDFAYTDGTLFVTIGLGAAQVNLGFGDGQTESGVTASLTDVLFTFDVELGFDVFHPNFFNDPLAHVSGPGLTGAFSLSARRLQVIVPDVFELDARGVLVEYDPNASGSQDILTVDQAELLLIPFNVTGTVENLIVRNDGFAFDDLEIEWNADPGMPLTMGGLFEVYSLGFGVSDFDLTFGQAFVFTGSLTIFTDAAVFLPGQPVEATVSQRPGSGQHGLSATLNFGADGSIESLMFHIDQLEIAVGSLLTITATDVDIDSGAWGDANQELVSFGSVGARVRLGSVIVGGEARNFAFMGDGAFAALGNFAVILSAEAVDGAGIGWPSWMPIRVTEIGLLWPDIENEPLDFILIVSAEVVGLHNLPLNFTGAIDRIQIDIDKLVNGEFPIVGVEGIAVGVEGQMFGGEITAQLLGGILRLDAAGNVIDSLDVTTPVDQSILFAGLEGGFAFPGIGGLTIRLGLSELGPLGVFINGEVPGGILLEPNSGLSINDFSAGVDFFTSLPDYTDPFELAGAAFGLPTDLTALEWLDQIRDQVAAQWVALQADPNMPSLADAFSETMTITGGAKLFSIYTSQQTFNGEVIIKFSTDGKFAITGKLNFAADNLSVSARLYADLSNVASGDVTILFLATAPDQAPIMTIFGELTLEFPTDGMILHLAGGVIYEAPLGVIGDVTGTGIQDVELFRMEGSVTMTLDTVRSLFMIDMDGTMSLVYLGTIGSVSGRLVMESPDSSDPLALPQLWGVLKLESGLDKLAQAGIELNAEALLQINTTSVEKTEVLRLIGIVGDELATVTDGVALADLDALSPVIPPLPLDLLPASVKALLETTLGGTLSATTTVEVIVSGAKWKVRDDDNDVTYFLEEVTGGQLKISGEFQEFVLAPETYMIQIRGDLIFRMPAFEADGITPGPDLLVISGGASMKISRDGLEAFVLGRAKVGPTGSELLEFDAQGVLIINDSGIAAGLSLQLDVSNIPGIDFTGGFTMVMNTTDGLQQVAIPTLFQDLLLPTPPTITDELPGDLIADDGDNTTLFWLVNDDGVTLTPVLVVPGEAPDLDGNFDPVAVNTPYLVISGNATLTVNPLGVDLLSMQGRFQITLEPSKLSVIAAFGTSHIILGTMTGTAALTLDGDGLYGVAQVTRDIGSPVIPAVELNLDFMIEFNTSAISKTIQRFEVDRTTGAIAATTVDAELEAFQVRFVAGGELRVTAAELVTMTGRFEFVISADELAISIAARLAIGGATPIDAAVEGAALLRADGFAFQILAAVSAGTSETTGGAGFILELGGSALVRVNTINESIDEIAGITVNLAAASGSTPYFEIRLEGAGRLEFFIDGIAGFKIEGEIRTLANNDGFAVNVDGEFTASLGGTTLLRLSASGSFQIFTSATSLNGVGANDGIAGKVTLSIGSTALLGGVGFDIDGTFVLEVNTTGTAINEIDGTVVNLAAGPYARIQLVGVIRFSLGGAASFELDGSGAGQGFAIEMNATRIAITADASLLAKVAGVTLLNLTVDDGLLAIGLDGIVANMNLGGGLSGPGFSFDGSFRFRLNTTGENVFVNGGVVLPGIQVEIIGDLNLVSGFQLAGQFAIELNNNGLVIDANANLNITVGGTTLVSLELIDSFLQISDRGIAAQISVGGRFNGPGFEFRASTVITLRINTTGQAVTRVNGRNVNLRAGYFAELELVGDLSFLNIITLKGRFVVTAGSTGLDVSMSASLKVMNIGFSINAAARITTSGIAFKAQIGLGSGGNTITPISGLSITGSFELQINTTNSTQLGMAARSVTVAVSGGINVLGFTLLNINFSIGVSASGFSASFNGTVDLSIIRISVSGSFDSSGAFSVTGSTGIYLTAGPAYLSATARLTISNTSGFGVRIDGSAGIKVAGVRVGVGVHGSAYVSGTSIRIRAEACIRINLVFSSYSICAGATFTIGRVPASSPGAANTNPDPSVGTVDGSGALALNLAQFGSHQQNISITNEGGGLLRVSGNGFSEVFSGVNTISLNLGDGDDYFYVGSGVAANVVIHGGNGNDEIVYLGSGTAYIDGGNGDDEIRIIDDRNFRAEPSDTGMRMPLGSPTTNTLIGGAGDDILIGGFGNDLIQGNGGHDRLDGGGGDDTIQGGSGDDIIYGGDGNDMLTGEDGNDVIYGEQGNDTLDGGNGDDILLGGSGSEVIYWTVGTGNDIEINGESGDDQIVFLGTSANNTISASQGENGAFVLALDGQSVVVNEFESAVIEGLGGSDDIEVNDLSNSSVAILELRLGDETDRDSVTVNGLSTDDEYTFSVMGETAFIQPTGGTRIDIINAGTAYGGSDILLLTGDGDDTVNIQQTVAGMALVVRLDVGDDEVVLGDAVTGVSQIAGAVTLHGDLHNDRFVIDASVNTAGITAVLNDTTLVSATIPAGLITFFDMEVMDLTFGSGDDSLTVNENLQTSVLNLAGGNDLIQVLASQGDLDVLGGSGDDTIWIGSNGSGGNGTLAGATGQMDFDGQTGNDVLFVDNAGDSNSNNFTVESALLTLGAYGNIPYANFEELTIESGSNDDTIVVASTHNGPTTIRSNAGDDTVHIQTVSGALGLSTAADDDTIHIGSVVSGSGTLNGILALVTLDSGAGNDTLNLDDSADIADNVGEITATTVTGFDMTSGVVYAALEFINFEMGSGHDRLTMPSASSATYEVHGHDGNDAFDLGTLNILDPLVGQVILHGDSGTNALNVNDSADAIDNNGELTSTTIRGLGLAGGIDYFDMATLDLTLGVANDQFTVLSTHTGVTTLNANVGNDTVWVETLSGNSSIHGDEGDDLIVVGKTVVGDSLPTIDHQNGQLTVEGGIGANTLTLDDRGNSFDVVIGIDGNQVAGLTDQPILYSEITILNILAGSGNEVLNVRGTTALETNVRLADGNEQIFISSAANATLANSQSIDFLLGHLDLLTGGDLNIDAGNGRHRLMISDEGATAADTVTITDSSAAAMLMGMEIIISGLATSNISYGAAASGNFADGVTMWTGFGNDVINIDATHFRDDVDAGNFRIRTITSLNTGLGDDAVTVTLLDGTDGFFVLHTQGPHDDQPMHTDADIVDASTSTLGMIIFGGQDRDDITGGQGRDIIFGDRGSVLFFQTAPADTSDWTASMGLAAIVLGHAGPGDRTDGRAHEPAFVRSVDESVGDNDIIRGQTGDDYIMGQAGDDQIQGGAGEDDIIGGHNVAGGPDGNDIISGGDDADVIIGDNGTIERIWNDTAEAFERHPAPFADVIRHVVLFDNLDGIGGDDIINGDAGDDILFGQRGNDTLDGGTGDDELTGGLGNNGLIGGDENDILVGGPAQILRAYNLDGSPLVDSNGSWHRDIVFELVGTVIGFIDINDTPIEYLMWSLAEEMMRADMMLVVGVYDADGNRVFDERRAEWKTRLLLIDLDEPGNDVIDGRGGDDIIIGGFGNDTLSGGAGNDLIIGDYGTNLLPYGTDLPLMMTGIRLRDDLTGTLDLDPLGTLVVPDFAVETVMTQATAPFMQVVPPHAIDLQHIANNDLIAATDNTFLDAFASIVPDIRHHLDSQPGNDMLDGGIGNDTLIGDNLTIRSPMETMHPAFSIALNSIVSRLVRIQAGLYHVSSMFDVIQTEMLGGTGGNTFVVASDTIIGGDGNDTIAGDNALWIGPAIHQWPIGSDILADGTALYQRMLDMDWAFSDTDHAIVWAKQTAHREMRRNRLFIPRVEIDRNTLSIRNDDIQSGDGDDTISGDDSIVDMPVVSSFAAFRNRTVEIRDSERERDTRRAINDLSQEIARRLASELADYALHIARDYRRLDVAARVDRDAGKVSFHLLKGNDAINAGIGDDMVAGDTLMIGKPAYNVLPVNRQEANRLRGPLRRMMNRTRTRGMFHKGTANYQVALKLPRRGPTRTEASDQIFGDAGNDVLVGDNAEMSPHVARDGSFDPTRHEVRSRPKMGNVYGDTHRGGDDTIDGGDGDDVIDGKGGFDTLDGGVGADQIYGGAQRDTVILDSDDTRATQGGQIRRGTLNNFSNGWMDRVTDVLSSTWSNMAATPDMWIRMRLRR